jgi:hypothetical protein
MFKVQFGAKTGPGGGPCPGALLAGNEGVHNYALDSEFLSALSDY